MDASYKLTYIKRKELYKQNLVVDLYLVFPYLYIVPFFYSALNISFILFYSHAKM